MILSGLACRLWIDVREARSSSDMTAVLEKIGLLSSWCGSDLGLRKKKVRGEHADPLTLLIRTNPGRRDLPRDPCSITFDGYILQSLGVDATDSGQFS